MVPPFTGKDVQKFAAFLEQVKRDVTADGADALLCFAAALGLVKREKPADVLPPINPTRQGKLAIIPCFHGEAEKLPGMLAMLLGTGGDIGIPANNLQNIMFRYRVASGVKGQYLGLKSKNLDIDPYNEDCYEILDQLKARLSGDNVMVDMGFMDVRPFIEEKLVEAVNQGASKIIVAHTMITISGHTEEIEERVERLGLKRKGVNLVFTEPFWNDERFIQHKVNRVLELVGEEDKSKVGVAMMAYGMPSLPTPGRLAWASAETTDRYANAYTTLLQKHGITNSVVGYLRWLKPDLEESAKILAENGAKVLIFDWFHASRNLHSLLDVPNHFEMLQLELPEDTKLVMVGPEKDSPGFIDVLVNQIQRAKEALPE